MAATGCPAGRWHPPVRRYIPARSAWNPCRRREAAGAARRRAATATSIGSSPQVQPHGCAAARARLSLASRLGAKGISTAQFRVPATAASPSPGRPRAARKTCRSSRKGVAGSTIRVATWVISGSASGFRPGSTIAQDEIAKSGIGKSGIGHERVRRAPAARDPHRRADRHGQVGARRALWRNVSAASIVNADSMQVYRDLQDHHRAARRSSRGSPALLMSCSGRSTAPRPFRSAGGSRRRPCTSRLARVGRRCFRSSSAAQGLYFKALDPRPVGHSARFPRRCGQTIRAESRGPGVRGSCMPNSRFRDPLAAARLQPSDPQRILRALEVHAATGQKSRKLPG